MNRSLLVCPWWKKPVFWSSSIKSGLYSGEQITGKVRESTEDHSFSEEKKEEEKKVGE